MKIKKSLLKYIFPKASIEARLALIRGEGELACADLVTVLYILTHDTVTEVSREAASAFKACSESTVMDALAKGLVPEVIGYIAQSFAKNEKVLDMAALDDNIDDKTLCALACDGPLSVIKTIIGSEKVSTIPGVLPALRSNSLVTRDLIDRAEELSRATTTERSGGEDGDEGEADKVIPGVLPNKGLKESESTNIYQRLHYMSVGDKVKLALTGDKGVRAVLIKQSNKVISLSVIRNPRITEDEIVKVIHTRSIPDELLREIARNKEWLKSYPVRKGLAFNPKTPIPITLRILSRLNDKDIAVLSKSRGVPGIVVASARKIVDRKKNQ